MAATRDTVLLAYGLIVETGVAVGDSRRVVENREQPEMGGLANFDGTGRILDVANGASNKWRCEGAVDVDHMGVAAFATVAALVFAAVAGTDGEDWDGLTGMGEAETLNGPLCFKQSGRRDTHRGHHGRNHVDHYRDTRLGPVMQFDVTA